ncbi:NitT/TauT family transport system substrate-binding protein [Clostridium cavendishii DSM 21758]|uniref:NitT/TauT family transport system substrate-binding protein n=1 Tax=Clostridium cavendishii DSM 21758 TaxID=1121302 RepID=A0A1M6NQJ2_9CLOT|nr:ABC transporter substrate-binding protein [Clostridium cavendishii]SHJ97842.1 NitT/TauT family transport system substrate-binding protein [Clostridium cavendishii DSM 21758]
MKKSKLFTILSVLMIMVLTLVSCGPANDKKDTSSDIKKVKLNEVVRSVFYAPMYVSIANGYFKDEGLDIDLSTGQGADKTMQQVLSKNADIGFCGPEQVIYTHNQGRDDYPVVFAKLTERDGSFLVARSKNDNFSFDTLKGKTIIGGRPGGVPEMALEYVLKNHELIPNKDVNLITNIDFTATAGAFKANIGDYVALFEPTASMLEQNKSGYIVASIGKEAGALPYTCFFSTKSYMDKNPDTILKFTKAIYKGQEFVRTHSDSEVASKIKSFFPGTSDDILINVIKNYRQVNAFSSDPSLKEEDMNRLMDIIQSYNKNLLPNRPSFNTMVNNSFADKVKEKN